jgi:hypothetical protein
MTRLQLALQRLYLPPPADAAPAGAVGAPLAAADGHVRALVLEVRGPASWAALSRVWQGVQADLGLPAPGIAVSGSDGFQLWFSLQQAVPAAQGAAWLEALRLRHLAELPLRRVRQWPAASAAGQPAWQPGAVPAPQADAGHWSAFVSQDLAPLFEDTPWLDTPPNPDGQAGLLAQLHSMAPADVAQAWQACGLPDVVVQPAPAAPAAVPVAPVAAVAAMAAAPQDPRQFLQAVMQDSSVPMALRIEAAKALLHAPTP